MQGRAVGRTQQRCALKAPRLLATLRPPTANANAIARFFKFPEYRTTIRTEVLAGITTFMTMAYILVVNPGILSDAIFLQKSGDLFNELVIATAISAAIATLVMGLFANYPFALAPGLGLNAFFAYSVVWDFGFWILDFGF